MVGTRIAAVLLAVITLGFAVGGTVAYVVTPGPVPTPVTPAPAVVYMITGGVAPAFAPYFTSAHTGPVEMIFVNQDHGVHAFMLSGTGLVYVVLPMTTLTGLAALQHAGVYHWINLVPYAGTPQGAVVGVLSVT